MKKLLVSIYLLSPLAFAESKPFSVLNQFRTYSNFRAPISCTNDTGVKYEIGVGDVQKNYAKRIEVSKNERLFRVSYGDQENAEVVGYASSHVDHLSLIHI